MKLLAAVVLVAIATAASARSPYAGMQTRPIKSLSDQQIADLKAGRGMGLALPAELNGYPVQRTFLSLLASLGYPPIRKPARKVCSIQ